ncbi:MAG: nitroreductase family protein [Ignavibacteria bacterium]|nr:nitroreductase family protein [Ignavibacteria bacterium]
MPIPTSRTNEIAHLIIDYHTCKNCGLCAEVCKDFTLVMESGVLIVNDHPLFGCMGCGQCAAVCPNGSIMVHGREMSAEDFIKQPARNERAGYDGLYSLMLSRRSIRDFRDKPVESEMTDKILQAAVSSPMGIPPSDVGVLVFNSKNKVRKFSFEFIEAVLKMRTYFSPLVLGLMKPFMKKENYELSRDFIVPMLDFFRKSKAENKNYLLYDAPLAMYFYNSGYADPADPLIPATYAMLAAHSMGLGSCMIGSIAPFLKYIKPLKKKYGLPASSKDGIFLIFGHPKYKYQKAIKRSFAKVDFV